MVTATTQVRQVGADPRVESLIKGWCLSEKRILRQATLSVSQEFAVAGTGTARPEEAQT